MLKLRKVELLGFKSFCEKTPITFSGSGITCIVGPNGCGKSNVVDAISWVLGEQSHKMLRAERMSDCIFNGTAKRPPMGLSEVTLTLVDPELADAVAKVLDAPERSHTAAARDAAAADDSRRAISSTLTMPSPAEDSVDDVDRQTAAESNFSSRPMSRRQGQAVEETRRRKTGDHAEARRSRRRPPPVSLRPKRIPDQWPRGALARRAGTFHGHRPGPG